MSPVIKSSEATRHEAVRAVRLLQKPAPIGEVASERDRLLHDLAEARALLAQRELELDGAVAAAQQLEVAAEKRGYEAGLSAAQTREEERLAVLESGVAKAAECLPETLSGVERLACAIAREALARVFGDKTSSAVLTEAAIVEAVRKLDDDALLRVEVSAQEFSDLATASARLTSATQRPVEVVVRPELAAGECRLRLMVGEIEVGPQQQWERLSALLLDLSAPGATS